MSSFLSLINPLAAAPLFSSLSAHETPQEKRRSSFKASLTTALALILFVAIGEFIFRFFGLTVHGFRIAGGVVFFAMGYEMLQAKDSAFKTTQDEKNAAAETSDYAITPLGIPMLCGPGSLSNAIILSRDATTWLHTGLLILSIVLVSIVTYFTLVGADGIVKLLGTTGLKVVKRIMGLILMVIAVEFIIAGSKPILIDILSQAAKR